MKEEKKLGKEQEIKNLTLILYNFDINFNVKNASTIRSFKWSPPFRFSN
jgi:hypothetical protein